MRLVQRDPMRQQRWKVFLDPGTGEGRNRAASRGQLPVSKLVSATALPFPDPGTGKGRERAASRYVVEKTTPHLDLLCEQKPVLFLQIGISRESWECVLPRSVS